MVHKALLHGSPAFHPRGATCIRGARLAEMVRWASRLCFACLGSALAETGSQEPLLRISVNLIQVDAVVTDSSGRQVTNLTAR
jgi:hypothetical protein